MRRNCILELAAEDNPMDMPAFDSVTPRLEGVSETLLITLAARAIGTAPSPGAPDRDTPGRDVTAQRLCAALGVDLQRYGASPSTIKGVLARGAWFDARCLRALEDFDDPLFVSLGSGLNTMYERVAAKAGSRRFGWIDSDLAEVVALRRRFLPDDQRRRTIVLDIAAPDWPCALGWTAGRPLVFVAEGVLMYFAEPLVASLFHGIARRFAGQAPVRFAFDWASPTMVRRSRQHPAIGRTKDRSIAFHWALRHARDIVRYDPRWRIVAEHDVMLQSGRAPALFGLAHRLITGRRFYGCAQAILQGQP
jgi:O-methyltransferase involved in polyketide biosynthesis